MRCSGLRLWNDVKLPPKDAAVNSAREFRRKPRTSALARRRRVGSIAVMKHTQFPVPQFYVTGPGACPYLEGRTERKIFALLGGGHAARLHDSLSRQGFRRSQRVVYRPCCPGCAACVSARIHVARFHPSRSQRRILRVNRDLARSVLPAKATAELFDLFRRYVKTRHAGGEMSRMEFGDFAEMVDDSSVRTRIVAHRDRDGRLVAACISDVLDDGLSLVYSFFDPDLPKRSLGRHVVLDHVAEALRARLPRVYLGYWVPGSPKMAYKSGFSGLEVRIGGRWTALSDPASVTPESLRGDTDSIAGHLASIRLPDSLAGAAPGAIPGDAAAQGED